MSVLYDDMVFPNWSMQKMAKVQSSEEVKGRRISIDLTPAAAHEVDRLRERLGLTTADLFRYSLHLMQIYVLERDRGKSLYVADAEKPDVNRSRIELAIFSPSYHADAAGNAVKKR